MADDAERQRDDNVWNPAVKPPVKKRLKDSLLRFLIVVRDWHFLQVTMSVSYTHLTLPTSDLV